MAVKHIVAVAPFWKRDTTAALFMAHMAAHKAEAAKVGVGLTVVVVGSEGEDSAALAGRHHYVESPNLPLGAKFNAGFLRARDLDPDYVMVLGSDTFFRPSVWKMARVSYMESNPDMLGYLDLYMYDLNTREAVYWAGYKGVREGEPIGPLRMLSHRLLEHLEWAPYDPTLSRNLDASMTKKLEGTPFTTFGIVGGDDAMIVSLKESGSVTKIDMFPDAVPVGREAIFRVLTQFS